jgi:hypothetical protein
MSEAVLSTVSLSIQDIVAIIGIFVGIAVAYKGVIEYRDSVNLRRAEWLHKLYCEFYVDLQLKGTREKLDSDEGMKRISAILEKPDSSLDEEETEMCAKFNDYLNFFEFMMHLRKTKALRDDDIIDMFEYYLSLLSKSKSIMNYLKREGYELLHQYLSSS